MITAFYMFRLIFKTFYGKPKKSEIFKHIHESPIAMTIPLSFIGVIIGLMIAAEAQKSEFVIDDVAHGIYSVYSIFSGISELRVLLVFSRIYLRK